MLLERSISNNVDISIIVIIYSNYYIRNGGNYYEK